MAWTSSWSWPTSSCTELGRRDISFTLIGSGDCFDDLVALSDRLELSDFVTFTGRIPDAEVSRNPVHGRRGYLAGSQEPVERSLHDEQDHGVHGVRHCPSSPSISARPASRLAMPAVYATPNDVGELAQLLVDLVDDEPRRRAMGMAGTRAGRAGAGMGASGSSLRGRLRAAHRRLHDVAFPSTAGA